MEAAPTQPVRIAPHRLTRWALALVGVGCVGVGAAGVFVPGLPTTVFLILATWCFTRSCPWLERRLIRNRLFAPFLGYLDRSRPMPRRARVAAIATMWAFVGLSIALLAFRNPEIFWASVPIAGAAGVGTVFIVRWNTRPRG